MAQVAEHRTVFVRSLVRFPAGRPHVSFFRIESGRIFYSVMFNRKPVILLRILTRSSMLNMITFLSSCLIILQLTLAVFKKSMRSQASDWKPLNAQPVDMWISNQSNLIGTKFGTWLPRLSSWALGVLQQNVIIRSTDSHVKDVDQSHKTISKSFRRKFEVIVEIFNLSKTNWKSVGLIKTKVSST